MLYIFVHDSSVSGGAYGCIKLYFRSFFNQSCSQKDSPEAWWTPTMDIRLYFFLSIYPSVHWKNWISIVESSRKDWVFVKRVYSLIMPSVAANNVTRYAARKAPPNPASRRRVPTPSNGNCIVKNVEMQAAKHITSGEAQMQGQHHEVTCVSNSTPASTIQIY